MKTIENIKIHLINADFESLKKDINDFDINQFDSNGSNILHYYLTNISSINLSVEKIINELIGRGIDINAKQTKINKRTALHIAVFVRNKDAFDFLIKNNIENDTQDKNGNTPLWYAVMYYQDNELSSYFITTLLKNGANPKLKNIHNVSPESLANDIANSDVRKYFQ